MDMTGDIAELMMAYDQTVREDPSYPTEEEALLRLQLIREEFTEVRDALEDILRDIKPPRLGKSEPDPIDKDKMALKLGALLDGLVDLTVVVIGTAHTFGLDFDEGWEIVHGANMAKVDPETGKVLKRADGKVLKPPRWTPPDVQIVSNIRDGME